MSEIMLVESAMALESLLGQRNLIERTMRDAMKEGIHYGKVPGCGDKPSLHQPGAQLLCYLFRVRADYEIIERELPGSHREYRITCKLIHMGSDKEVGQGIGICSSMESKFRFRSEAKEIIWTTEPVPGVYWDKNKKDKEEARKYLEGIYGDGAGVKKDENGQWLVVNYKGGDSKVENPNLADTFNTVLKMAKKRAYVDATITATASNDLFTQDLEDIRDNLESLKSNKADAKETDKTEQNQAPEKPETVGSWKDQRVHFGKPGGPLKGKRLGDIPQSSLDYLRKSLQEKRTLTKEDSILLTALIIEEKSRATEEKRDTDKLMALANRLGNGKIDSEKFVAVAMREQWIKGSSFEEITEDEADAILNEWEEVTKKL